MAEGDGMRRLKRSSNGASGLPSAPVVEDSRRTTRAASKRAANDDVARVAYPSSGVQQAKKRAALADLSNHSTLPASRTSSPVSEINAKKRAAISSVSSNANASLSRTGALGSGKASTVVTSGAGKTRTTITTVAKKIGGEGAPALKREVAQEKVFSRSLSAGLTPAPMQDQENVPPPLPKKQAEFQGESKLHRFIVSQPAPDAPNYSSRSNASVIASLERRTLENLHISRESTVGQPQTYMNIDCDAGDPQMCSVYATDIYEHLRMQEVKRRPSNRFMESLQQDINSSMRGILVDWLVEVAEEYKLVPDTLYLTVSFIDRFLSTNIVTRQRLQLLGVSCMLIAAKYEEICAPQVEEFCYITDNTYNRDEVLDMERRVLSDLHFELTTPTTKSFLRRFIRAAQAGYTASALQLEFLGNYLAELTLVEYNFLHYLPSLVAASAVFVAKLTLDSQSKPWNATLQHYSGYRASELQNCAREIHELQMSNKTSSLPAIRDKYSQHKFKCVANLSSPAKIPSEYFEDNGM